MNKKTRVFLLVAAATGLGTVRAAEIAPREIEIASKFSLAHLGSIDSFDMTDGGKRAGRTLWNALTQHRPELAGEAARIYEELIPLENFGSEYTALQWFCEYLQATPERQAEMTTDPFVREFCRFFADDDFAVLKEYLERKYRLTEPEAERPPSENRRLGYLDDFILFNNPWRERWEQTGRLLEAVPIEEGQTILDIGCGPGHFTYRFSRMVGPSGTVYAVDMNDLHINYLSNIVGRVGMDNVRPVLSTVSDIQVTNRADLAFMCSLYHVIYMTMPQAELDSFIGSIRRALKPGGALVVVDNSPATGDMVPYHGPHLARELVEAQLTHYGFRLQSFVQVIPQRYVLVFRLDAEFDQPAPGARVDRTGNRVAVATRKSLIHVPNDDSPHFSQGGREAAKVFCTGLETGARAALEEARSRYGQLVPLEQFGDEYTAFAWICDYELAGTEARQALRTGLNGDYIDTLKGENWAPLLRYVRTRYRPDEEEIEPYRTSGFEEVKKRYIPGDTHTPPAEPPAQAPVEEPLAGEAETLVGPELLVPPAVPVKPVAAKPDNEKALTLSEVAFWRDFILFNNPRREEWERSGEIVAALALKPGEQVADIGSGPGYYSYKFARLVGATGRVYAVDTNSRHLDFLRGSIARHGATNIVPVESRFDDCLLEEDTVDTVFMCSLYTIIYTTSTEAVKDRFVNSLKRALRPGGRLVVVDNDVVADGILPYHGPFMNRDLIIAQLAHYGFDFVGAKQIIPQRYMLFFELQPETREETTP